MASAKFAKRTVNQSQSVIWRSKRMGWWRIASSMSSADVTTLPTSTTNMTGFFIMRRGSSLRKESTIA
jgi:hypothetical protein